MSPAVADLIQAWEALRLAHGPGWYWVLTQQHGDLYHGCVLATAFRETHGGALPLILVVRSEGQRALAELFRDRFDHIVVEPRLASVAHDWRAFRMAREAPSFGPETPIVLHPGASPEVFGMDWLVFYNHLTWMALYKQVLRLPGDAEPRAPPRNPAHARDAAALCREHAMVPGRAAILFPYARSLAVEAIAPMALLAERLKAQGLQVMTSVAGPEAPVPGTQPISIPFHLLIDVAEFAGRTIAVRSGIDDILSSARAFKTCIYPNSDMLRLWDLGAMGLCRDTRQLLFDFASQPPETFPEVVLDGAALDGRLPLRTLSDEVCAAFPGTVTTARFPDWQRAPSQVQAGVEAISLALQPKPPGLQWRRQSGRPGAASAGSAVARLTDLPPRDHPRWADFIDEAVQTWTASLPEEKEVRFYACRDIDRGDVLEAVDRRGLQAGLYRAGRAFHTLIAVRGPALDSTLPPVLAARVLPLERIAPPHQVELSDRMRPGLLTEQINTGRPLSFDGIQLLDGWFEPERFGVWTRGLRSELKFALSEPARGGLRLAMHCGVALSPAHPQVSLNVAANGVPIATQIFTLGQGPDQLIIDIPESVAVGQDVFWIRFDFPVLLSPAQQGSSDDARLLGLGVMAVRIEAL